VQFIRVSSKDSAIGLIVGINYVVEEKPLPPVYKPVQYF
jgi:hypothetical protein